MTKWGAGSRWLVAQGKDSLWSVRPVEKVQTRRASGARPSIVTGATGRGSAAERFSTEGQAGIGRGLSAVVFAEHSLGRRRSVAEQKPPLSGRGGISLFGSESEAVSSEVNCENSSDRWV